MRPQDALNELLVRVGASNGAAVLLNEEELNNWPVEAVKTMKQHKLLVKARPASSVVCPGCEEQCVMPVHTLAGEAGCVRTFVVCDKRDDMNRVDVAIDRVEQWQCSAESICRFVAQSLGLRASSRMLEGTGLWEIGLATGNKRSQMLCLRAMNELELVVGNNAVPLTELMHYKAGSYTLDFVKVRQQVDAATTGDTRYTPSNARREANKLDTQAKYKNWQKEYRALKQRRPEMSDVWYSQQIAKMDIGKGRSAETIRKHMKR